MNLAPAKKFVAVAWLCAHIGCLASLEASEPYPLEYWALRDVVASVSLSPNGDRLALLRITSRDADPILEVYDTSDLSKDPFRFNSDPMELTGYTWVSNDVIAFNARQAVRQRIEGFNRGVWGYRFGLLNIESEEIRSFDQDELAEVVNLLPDKPNHVIVAYENYDRDGPGARVNRAFRPAAYWEYNIQTGARKLLIRGKLRLGAISFDPQGRPRIAGGFDERDGYYRWYYRGETGKDWEEIIRIHEDEWDLVRVGGIDEENPGHLFLYAQNGHNTEGLWLFNVERKEFVRSIYLRSDVDIGGLTYHSNTWGKSGIESGVTWYKDKRHVEYWDAEEAAIERQLTAEIPHAYDVRFRHSRNEEALVISNRGPRDPGTYYLLKKGKLQVIGSQQPLLGSEKLADVRYITYQSRDGRMIPAYITVPNSEPPFPLVVMPHGGPFVREVVSYDEWGQMLANNGYLVLQPQYRGSLGYGLKFFQSAFIESGQGGYKMQDDKDDGALYLVEQGLADAERIAMFGWSYGGYAALVAASRTPQIYQCVIAGAAVADNNEQVNEYRYELRGSAQTAQLNFWDDSISPIQEVEKVNVPLLLVHGTVDQRVPPKQAKLFRDGLEKFNKQFKYVELEGADHFSNTLRFDHQLTLYESMIDYLQNECGPGGL